MPSPDNEKKAPWMCHVCGEASTGESVACEACFRTVCPAHLCRTVVRNADTGRYRFSFICSECAAPERPV